MRFYYNTDMCIMASGTIRGDQIYPPGVLRLKDIMNCFPFEDPVVVLRVSGKAVREALENGMVMWPALEGRFPQVSGLRVVFDVAEKPGRRVRECVVGGQPLDDGRTYLLATRGYMARGKDGYNSLLVRSEGGEAEEVVSEEEGVLISTIVRQFFLALKVVDRWRGWGPSMHRHWDGVVKGIQEAGVDVVHPNPKKPLPAPVERARREATTVDEVDSDHAPSGEETPKPRYAHHDREGVLIRRVLKKWRRLASVRVECEAIDEIEVEEFCISWTKVH
jgi:5'-nucleotidase